MTLAYVDWQDEERDNKQLRHKDDGGQRVWGVSKQKWDLKLHNYVQLLALSNLGYDSASPAGPCGGCL